MARDGCFADLDPGPDTALDISYALVDRRPRGGIIMPEPSSSPVAATSDTEEESDPTSDMTMVRRMQEFESVQNLLIKIHNAIFLQ